MEVDSVSENAGPAAELGRLDGEWQARRAELQAGGARKPSRQVAGWVAAVLFAFVGLPLVIKGVALALGTLKGAIAMLVAGPIVVIAGIVHLALRNRKQRAASAAFQEEERRYLARSAEILASTGQP